jgi:hypothetical protein
MLKKKIYETSFEETEFIAVTAYQNDEVNISFEFFNKQEFLCLRSQH